MTVQHEGARSFQIYARFTPYLMKLVAEVWWDSAGASYKEEVYCNATDGSISQL